MREHPWHARRATQRHFAWYRNLLDLHALTLAWLRDLNVDRPSHFLGLSISADIRDSLRKLEQVAQGAANQDSLESLLDDTSPDDLLGRLENTIRTVQAITLRSLLDRVEGAQHKQLINELEQVSWKAGRDCAGARWPTLCREQVDELPGIIAAAIDCPLGNAWEGGPLLVRRLVKNEFLAELRRCPHESTSSVINAVADTLCELQLSWMRGYAYALNSKVVIDQSRRERCRQRWFLHG